MIEGRDASSKDPKELSALGPKLPPGWGKLDFLTSTNQATSWIGLFKDGQGSAHRWMDGSAPTYINLDSGKLDDNGTTQACVMMLYQGHWSNSSCKSESPVYICEKRQSC
ncbi:C-type lectin domain family 4 member G-like [Pan paniscus]|uniref:C-type lectin domain family 4 member G n=1 Tax=Pan troglodytes TaxID=9598 RepID=UPI0000E2501F|nr:C-type lectin domain family 4 member G [Pan troglodytes]XP_057156625.1 C-type lectin domain family 4 member G-like [Pan paniscus]